MMWKSYISVSTLEEAALLLSQHGASARIIAGGTDLLLEIERGQRKGIETLIDITRVAGLSEIREVDDNIVLGPLVLHNHVVDSLLIREKALPLAQACWEVGAPQIRNRGTVAGNLITASPANDTITPLMAMDASVKLQSVRGVRTVPLSEFYAGVRRTVMQPDELLSEIVFPALKPNERGVFLKLGLRRAQAISVVDIAVVIEFDGDAVARTRIAMGSVAPTIIRLTEVETYLTGKQLSEETIREAAITAGSIPKPIDDVRSTATYRSEMIRVLMARSLHMLANNAIPQLPEHPPKLWGASEGRPLSETSSYNLSAEDMIVTTINGEKREFTVGYGKTLLRFLREDAGMPGTKEGCAEGECGACTVYLDGVAVMACLVPAPRAHHAEIVTVEGLANGGELHPVQAAFIEHAAVQCGYCTPGFLMAGAKLLEECPHPTREDAEQSITGNLCRCTGYYPIVNALMDAAQKREEIGS
ncbi:MAG: FAD binding domain-containing protein [Anaerolineae bacterium]|nr:FAD binding domain-containing protein [Anaerolineae bacterium]